MNFYEPSTATVSAIVAAKKYIFFRHILYAPSRAEEWLVIFRCGMRPSGNFLLVESRRKVAGKLSNAPILMKMAFPFSVRPSHHLLWCYIVTSECRLHQGTAYNTISVVAMASGSMLCNTS
eukprot:scaffold1358_cov70-Skeletonema_marinoi.AAC.2